MKSLTIFIQVIIFLITRIECIPTTNKTIAITNQDHLLTFNNGTTSLHHDEASNHEESSFASIYRLKDGEIVTKFKWKNFSAIETRYHHIDLIQLIKDENRIIQFWLSNGELIDCEFTNDTRTIKKIHMEFNKINPNMKKDSKTYEKLLEEHRKLSNMTTAELPDHLKRLTEYETYEQQCLQLHNKVQHHFQDKMYQIYNNNGRKRRRSRTKRDSLIFPGTKWCGKGSNVNNFEDLGDYSFADRCCRDHDRCLYNIGPFQNQYHLFNYRFHYVSHCSCDERFRSCLKVSNSGAANLVGKIFFNVVQTKCFMFKMDDVCVEHSWWGTCNRYKRRKRAVFREPLPY